MCVVNYWPELVVCRIEKECHLKIHISEVVVADIASVDQMFFCDLMDLLWTLPYCLYRDSPYVIMLCFSQSGNVRTHYLSSAYVIGWT